MSRASYQQHPAYSSWNLQAMILTRLVEWSPDNTS